MSSFVVTTSVLGSSRTLIWNPERPLALGHPFQWVLEKTQKGLRVRDVSRARNQVISNGLTEIPEAQLQNGAELELGGKSPVSLRIRPVAALSPAFENQKGSQLSLFACAGSWVHRSTALEAGKAHEEAVNEVPAFAVQRTGDKVIVSTKTGGLVIRTREDERKLESGQSFEFATAQAGDAEIALDGRSWRFGFAGTPDFTPGTGELADPEQKAFLLALRYSGIALATLVALSWFWPQAKEDPKELIPPQVAKLVLSKPKAAGQTKAETVSAAANAPKKVQDAAVVQAFRAKALQNAVSGLLKGGMTSLLAQSDFVAGASASQDARKIFDAKSTALKATGPDAGSLTNKNVQVAALGGAAGGTGVGYGKGEHAGVKGQGRSFVTMDTGNSSVDEGLTKDEVGEVIHRHLSEVRYCYESAMLRTPDIEGKLMVSFMIAASGAVKTAEAKSSTLPDARLDDCIIRRLMTWKFPQPRGGIDVAVSYPFIFKTLGR